MMIEKSCIDIVGGYDEIFIMLKTTNYSQI